MIPEINNILNYAIKHNEDDTFFGEKQIFRNEKEQLIIKMYNDFVIIDLVILPKFAKEGYRNSFNYSIPKKQLKSITVKRMILQDTIVEHKGDIGTDIISYFEDKLSQFFENYTPILDIKQLENEANSTKKLIEHETKKYEEITNKLIDMYCVNYKPLWETIKFK